MNAMIYKNYTARIEFDGRDNIFVGRIAGIRDRVSFHADTVAKLRIAFKEAVEDYIETCAKVGKSPEKPASASRISSFFIPRCRATATADSALLTL